MDYARDLARIALQEERLQFERFDADVAWEIGSYLRNAAAKQGKAIAIDITLAGMPLFFHSMLGTSPSNADWIRRKKRAPLVEMPEGIDVAELAAEQGPTESIEDLVARHEMSRIVAEGMKLLPEEQRTAIVLKEYHGLTLQEIADLQGCPLSKVKARLYQGLTVLRRHLESQGMTSYKSDKES